MSTDVLSEVLRAVRLSGAVFFRVECSPPWVAEAPAASVVAPHIMPGAEHVIEYHMVTKGACWAGPIGQPALRLEEGDVLVFPQGDSHVLSSDPGMRATPDLSSYRRPDRGELPIAISLGPSGPAHTELVCGFLGCDSRPFNPLLSTLPRVLHVPRVGEGPLSDLVRLAVAECGARRAGSETMLSRLSELLFIEVVRSYIRTLPHDTTGWLAGLRDEFVGRALSALHDRPQHDWTIEDLAKEIGQSRSMLAQRFHHFVGIPPIQYLARWRLQLAAGLLSSSTATLAEIADRVGYGSEAALSRAFKRWVGVSPSSWRSGQRTAG